MNIGDRVFAINPSVGLDGLRKHVRERCTVLVLRVESVEPADAVPDLEVNRA